jgi:hypothetical protein
MVKSCRKGLKDIISPKIQLHGQYLVRLEL